MKSFLGTGLRRWILVAGITCIVAGGGYVALRRVAWPRYKDWRAQRINRVAREYMAKGDYENALLAVRNNLRDNQRYLDTWELAAEIAKAKNSPDAILYLDHIAKSRGTLAPKLEEIRLALRFGYLRYALDTVASVGPAGRDSADFHRLAAETYQRVGRPIDAKYQLVSLTGLRPDDGKAQLDLAAIELEEAHFQGDSALRARLEGLARQPDLRIRATSLLLEDAIARRSHGDSKDLAERLALLTPLRPADRVLVLRGLSLGDAERAAAYRDVFEREAASDPEGIVALLGFFLETRDYERADRWYSSLPEKSRRNTGVQRAMADVRIAARDWPGIVRELSGADWGPFEYERHADLADEARQTGQLSNFVSDWKFAVIQAGDSAADTLSLMQRIVSWGWRDERYDLLWKLFALDPRDESIRRPLVAWERYKGNTSGLNQIFSRVREIDPQNRENNNNYAYTSMLLDANLWQAYQIAAKDHAADPRNAFFTSTEALALYKQGKAADALALMGTLDFADASMPERLLSRAVFSAAAGDGEGARALIEGLEPTRFLPEERDLMEKASASANREETARVERKRDYAEDRGKERLSGGWLEIVPQLLPRAQASMAQSNALYARHDSAGLAKLLRQQSWPAEEHIRLALLAYAIRGTGDEAQAREAWVSALGEAGFDTARLQDLGALANEWGWRKERFEVLDRIYEHRPEDAQVFAELRDYYRVSGRTQDLIRVLDSYVTYHPSDDRAMGEFSYYSMLCGINLARAYVAAKNGYDLAPESEDRRLIYAFSLWKQKRPDEAWSLIQHDARAEDTVVPEPLLRGAVLMDLGRKSDALMQLRDYRPSNPLPEETHLISALRRDLGSGTRLSLSEDAARTGAD